MFELNVELGDQLDAVLKICLKTDLERLMDVDERRDQRVIIRPEVYNEMK